MKRNKYCLTDKEKEWLENRVHYINQCENCEFKFSFMCSDCPERGYYDSLYPNYYDALMFESHVKLKLISMDYNDVPCAHNMVALCPRRGGSFPGCGNWCLLREAELMVEEEMEREAKELYAKDLQDKRRRS